MSLGTQLAPHLPFLRRFGRSISGSQAAGDRIVRATLEQIVSDPDGFPRNVDPRLGLYRLFLDLWHEHGDRQQPTDDTSVQERVGHARLEPLRGSAREALLLTAMEGFTAKDAGYLLERSPAEINALVTEALREIEKQTKARILIIEDEPMIAMDIETIVRDLGHEVTAVAITRAEAVESALNDRPGLILADIQLADNSSGIDAVTDILSHFDVPVIYITAFPERLLTGERPTPTFLITKPFQRSTVKAAISQALFFDRQTLPEPAPDEHALASERVGLTALLDAPPASELAARELRMLDPAVLEPLPAPVDATVVGKRLRVVRSASVKTRLGRDRIAKLWQVHAATANRIAADLDGSNAGRAFVARIEAVRHALAATPNDNDALAIGVQSHGLAGMLPAVRDALMPDVTADIESFLTDLRQLARHFTSYREFVGEAEQAPVLPPKQQAALIATAKLLEAAPDDAIDPALKESIGEVRTNAEESPDAETRLALLRTVGNVLKALGRYLRDISKEASKKFKEEIGGALGKLAVTILTGGVLVGLAYFTPAGFSWILPMLVAAGLLSKNSKGKSAED